VFFSLLKDHLSHMCVAAQALPFMLAPATGGSSAELLYLRRSEEGDEPISNESSVAVGGAEAALVPKGGGHSSANRNSTTKPNGGCRVFNGDASNTVNRHGSNTADGHGSNNGNGASTTHVYASRATNAPLVYRTTDAGSGEGSGGGSGDGGFGGSRGNGSGQGSGSGNQELAAGQRLASDSPELQGQVGAAGAGANGGLPGANGSSGNSGVGNMEGEALAAAKRATAEKRETDGTAQGKHMALQPAAAQAAAAGRSPTKAAAAAAAAVSKAAPEEPAQAGFRAWVSPPFASAPEDGGGSHRNGSSLKRSASFMGGAASLGHVASLPLPPVRNVRARVPASQSPAAALTPRDRFGSACTGAFTSAGTSASELTHFGSSGLLGASVTLRCNGSDPSPKVTTKFCKVPLRRSLVALVTLLLALIAWECWP